MRRLHMYDGHTHTPRCKGLLYKTRRTKHLSAVYHYIRQEIEEGQVRLIYVPRAGNMTGGLTKLLNGLGFRKFIDLLSIKGDSDGKGKGDKKVIKTAEGK